MPQSTGPCLLSAETVWHARGITAGGLRYHCDACGSERKKERIILSPLGFVLLRMSYYQKKKKIYSTTQNIGLYHIHLQPPPFRLIWPPLLACDITMATGTRGRERERETRRMIRWGSHANFAMLFKELVSKRSAFRTWAIHFICSEQLGNEYHGWSPRQHCCPFFTGTLDITCALSTTSTIRYSMSTMDFLRDITQ